MVEAAMRAALVQAVMRVMGSDGEPQMKLCSRTRRSPPAVRPSSYRSVAQGLGTPDVPYILFIKNKTYHNINYKILPLCY